MTTTDQRYMGLRTGISYAERLGVDTDLAWQLAIDASDWRDANPSRFDGMMG